MSDKLKIGVLGAGHLGKIHLRQLLTLQDDYSVVGFYDPDSEKARQATEEFGLPAYSTINELIDAVDVVDIVTPTLSHYTCAMAAIKAGKHFFIEKPLTNTIAEASELVELTRAAGLKGQVGHVERFNPAFVAAQEYDLAPLFVEGHRLAEFKPRGTDVSVVLDLMIHDIDILLSMMKAPITQISASGVSVISDNVDIANARIEFANGATANLTASRVSLKNERKLRIFQKNAYISIDFQRKELNVVRLRELAGDESDEDLIVLDPGDGKPKKEILYNSTKPAETNAIREELRLFAQAIRENTEPIVTLEDGYHSLSLAHRILEKIEEQVQKSLSYTA